MIQSKTNSKRVMKLLLTAFLFSAYLQLLPTPVYATDTEGDSSLHELVNDADDAEGSEVAEREASEEAKPGNEVAGADAEREPAGAVEGIFSLEDSPEHPVRLVETGELYDTMTEAITAANAEGISAFTLEVIDNVTEAGDVLITSDVTLVAAEGNHIVTLAAYCLRVQSGGTLTLGDGIGENQLTISTISPSVNATNGAVHIRAGVTLRGIVLLNGANVTCSVSGGIIRGSDHGLEVMGGARVISITGGEIYASNIGLLVSGNGSRVDEISGGSIYQTNASVTLNGQAVFVQNQGRIGTISGGYFQSSKTSALGVVRGSWVELISGGEFVSLNASTNGVIVIYSEDYPAGGINSITNCQVSGGRIGIWMFGEGSRIDSISGGSFVGGIGIQNEPGSVIKSITGGEIYGRSYGIFAAGSVKSISGQAEIIGGRAGIWVYENGSIGEISGGLIATNESSLLGCGILNNGLIEHISGGVIIGDSHAIDCLNAPAGRLNLITGGAFWAKYSDTFRLAHPLILEPDITASKGDGRYLAGNDIIFNDDSLVTYPDGYEMSTKTLPVPGIDDADFRYLTLSDPPEYRVTVVDSFALNSGESLYFEDEVVTIGAGSRPGYTFAGWVTSDDVVFADAGRASTYFTMPVKNVTVTATWTKNTTPPPPSDNTETPKTGDSGVAAALLASLTCGLGVAILVVHRRLKIGVFRSRSYSF
ncbi:MAG: hypothetical protein FWD45_00040 [Coriobacteriia bacterium]|nr:hypothetical protein [Coriobacteriia bacterium]